MSTFLYASWAKMSQLPSFSMTDMNVLRKCTSCFFLYYWLSSSSKLIFSVRFLQILLIQFLSITAGSYCGIFFIRAMIKLLTSTPHKITLKILHNNPIIQRHLRLHTSYEDQRIYFYSVYKQSGIIMNEPQSDRRMSSPQQDPTQNSQTHQKNYINVRINADDQSSTKLIIYSAIIIFILVLVSILAQYAIPSAVVTIDAPSLLAGTPLEDCNNDLIEINKSLHCGFTNEGQVKRGQYVRGGVRLNQFFAFYLQFDSGFKDRLKQTLYFRLSKVTRLWDNKSVQLIVGQNILEKQIDITQIPSNRGLFYLDFINKLSEDEQFYWQVELQTNSALQDYGFYLQTKTINTQYSIFCIVLRCAFFGISLLFCIFGMKRYKKSMSIEALPEQKITLFLSLLTVTFNDPFYAITILLPNLFTSVLSTIFYWNFLTFLVIIWIFFLQRIKDEQSKIQTNLLTFKQASPLIPFYILTFGYRIGSSIYQTYNHPFIDGSYKSSTYLTVTFILSFAAFLAAAYYIFKLYCTIWQQRSSLMWRSKVFLKISFFFFVIVFYLFMVGAFEVFSYSPKKLLFSFTFTNIYSYYLQYLYYESKSANEQFEQQKVHRQPSFVEFEDKQISIDLQQDHFQDFEQYGMSKLQPQNQTTISYLGQFCKQQGSQIECSNSPQQKS